jgi:hypothetical protein
MNTKLEVGDVFEARQHMRVYAMIPSHFAYINRPNDPTPAKQEVHVGCLMWRDDHELDLGYLKGCYVVEHAAMEGGGTGHGAHDIYPDGWHIRARKLKADGSYNPMGVEIEFYQSGAFTVVNEKVPVVGKLHRVVDFVAE